MKQGFEKYSDLRQGYFLNSAFDMGINKRQRPETLAFLKIDRRHGDLSSSIQRPHKKIGGTWGGRYGAVGAGCTERQQAVDQSKPTLRLSRLLSLQRVEKGHLHSLPLCKGEDGLRGILCRNRERLTIRVRAFSPFYSHIAGKRKSGNDNGK